MCHSKGIPLLKRFFFFSQIFRNNEKLRRHHLGFGKYSFLSKKILNLVSREIPFNVAKKSATSVALSVQKKKKRNCEWCKSLAKL
jgi:hypothetical protein